MVDLCVHSASMRVPPWFSDLKIVDHAGRLAVSVLYGMLNEGFPVVITSAHGHGSVGGMGDLANGGHSGLQGVTRHRHIIGFLQSGLCVWPGSEVLSGAF